MTNNPQRNLSAELHEQFGLDTVSLKYGLSQDELFFAAIENDRGRVDSNGDSNQQKAFQTALGVDGPLAITQTRHARVDLSPILLQLLGRA